jgi:hypothetical protein
MTPLTLPIEGSFSDNEPKFIAFLRMFFSHFDKLIRAELLEKIIFDNNEICELSAINW